MREYRLKLLMLTSEDIFRPKQYETITVKADGFSLTGDGRVYKFYRTEITSGNKKVFPTIACYPTHCTVIDNIQDEN